MQRANALKRRRGSRRWSALVCAPSFARQQPDTWTIKHSGTTARQLLCVLCALCVGFALLSGCSGKPRPQPANDEWTVNGHDFAAQRFSPLVEIDSDSVRHLELRWVYHSRIKASFQATPLVSEGIMYLSLPFSHVVALDARDGRELWRYEHKPRTQKLCCGPANRGVALARGKVYVGTVDGRLIALDAHNGKVLWDIDVAGEYATGESPTDLSPNDTLRQTGVQGSTGVAIAMAPTVFEGKVLVGITGVGYGLHMDNAVVGMAGRFGRAGFIAAFDAESGRKLWQFDAVQPGWEGSYRASTPDGLALNRNLSDERANAGRHADAWRYGGGSIWATPTVDAERKLIFFGTGNPSPQMEDRSRPGDNLYTASLIALDANSGKLVWHYQQVPHDRWGYDVANPPILFDLIEAGQRIPAVAQASKLGWVYVHDRRDGRLLFKSDPFVPQEGLFTPPAPEGVTIAPGIAGGANWSPSALDAKRKLLFVPAIDMPTRYIERTTTDSGGAPRRYLVAEPQDKRHGTLTAIDLAHDGKVRWQQRFDEPLVGGVLATAGGLVFSGIGHDELAAFNSQTGDRLWHYRCDAGVNAPPISYAIDGKQYIAVAAGGNSLFGFPTGDTLMVFALPD